MDKVNMAQMSDLPKRLNNNWPGVKVCLVDYGSGNVLSVLNMIEGMGIPTKVSHHVQDMDEATHIILPGVGAFGDAMGKLSSQNLIESLERNVLEKKKPYLGICLGMQILASRGTEHGQHDGLGWIPGTVERMEVGELPLPHVGWNNLLIKREAPLVDGISDAVDFYFVHSYCFNVQDEKYLNAVFDYGGEFAAVVSKGNIMGTQFHPEKSQKAGKLLLSNFFKIK